MVNFGLGADNLAAAGQAADMGVNPGTQLALAEGTFGPQGHMSGTMNPFRQLFANPAFGQAMAGVVQQQQQGNAEPLPGGGPSAAQSIPPIGSRAGFGRDVTSGVKDPFTRSPVFNQQTSLAPTVQMPQNPF